MKKTVWNKFFIGFFNGVVILMPIIITVILIKFLVIKVNDIVLEPFLRLISAGGADISRVYFAKGLILIGVVFFIAVIGWAARILFINRVFSWGERILIKVPIMGRIYNAVKQISSAFLGQGKTIFKQVVMVEYPRKGLYSLGFTTGTSKGELRTALGRSGINVFVPTTPNPTSGIFIVVPKEEVRFLKMSVEDGMKLVVSGGSFTPLYMDIKADGTE